MTKTRLRLLDQNHRLVLQPLQRLRGTLGSRVGSEHLSGVSAHLVKERRRVLKQSMAMTALSQTTLSQTAKSHKIPRTRIRALQRARMMNLMMIHLSRRVTELLKPLRHQKSKDSRSGNKPSSLTKKELPIRKLTLLVYKLKRYSD